MLMSTDSHNQKNLALKSDTVWLYVSYCWGIRPTRNHLHALLSKAVLEIWDTTKKEDKPHVDKYYCAAHNMPQGKVNCCLPINTF